MSKANIPVAAAKPKAPFSKFPGMRWNPETGDSKLCQTEADVPTGWLDQHPTNKAAPAEPVIDMPRDEIIKELSAGGVPVKKNASTAALYELLVSNLRSALTEQGVAFSQDATARALLELFPKD